MGVTATDVKKLRERTGLGIMQCKRALLEADGDAEKALEILRRQGLETAAKKAGRTTGEGCIGQYVHTNGKIGVLLELRCETDFVAKSQDFQDLLHDLCMQVAASAPTAVSREDIPEHVLEKEKDIYRAQFADKPDHIRERIVEGKLGAFYQRVCLLEQPFIKDPDKTVQDRINETLARLKENIVVRRFVRLEVGDDEE